MLVRITDFYCKVYNTKLSKLTSYLIIKIIDKYFFVILTSMNSNQIDFKNYIQPYIDEFSEKYLGISPCYLF